MDLGSPLLNNNNWLNNTIIESYFLSFVEVKKLYVLSSFYASFICLNNIVSMIDVSLDMYDFISGPVFIDGNHWCLLFIDNKNKTITYIDSLKNNNSLSLMFARIKKNWNELWLKNNNNTSNFKWNILQYDHILQNDGANCGVFVCYFFKYLLEENINLLNYNFNTDDFRKQIETRIIDNSKEFFIN